MWIPQVLRQFFASQTRSTQLLAEITAGIDNQQRLTNDKMTEAIMALADISNALRLRLDAVVAGSDQQQRLLNDKLNAVIEQLSNMSNVMEPRLNAMVKGLENNTQVLNNKMNALIAGSSNQTRVLNDKLNAIIEGASRSAGDPPVASSLNLSRGYSATSPKRT